MSHAYSPYGTVACLDKANGILGPKRVWNGVNDAQRGFLDVHARLVNERSA